MKVLFTGLFPLSQCHFVGECNFIEEHLTAGDDVDVLTCDASLNACDANPMFKITNCLTCMGIREDAFSMLASSVGIKPIISESSKKKIKEIKIPIFQSMSELKSFRCFDSPVGSDVISSVMSVVADSDFDTIVHAERIKKNISDYIHVYLTALEYLKDINYSLVYLFNGRFGPAKAWIRACEARGVDYFTLERLGMPDRVIKIKNGTVHGFSSYAPRIREFWNTNKGIEDVRKEAIDFFEERPKGLLKGWNSFIKGQDNELLPSGWDPSKLNMAVFSSTETEFAGIPEVFDGALYDDQKSCYLRIAQILKEKDSSIHLYLRIHPNSKSEKNYWWDCEEFHNISNLTVIPPESPISSYRLMKSCVKTIVFMTTMGIEASYWGKPSILLSNSMYKGIGAVYEPSTEEEAIRLILDKSLEPKPKEATLAYGAFHRKGTSKLPYSQALDRCTLTFKGNRPKASDQVLHSRWKWENYVNKPWIPKIIKKLWEWSEFKRVSKNIYNKYNEKFIK